jgi:hypothetical protein
LVSNPVVYNFTGIKSEVGELTRSKRVQWEWTAGRCSETAREASDNPVPPVAAQ